MKRTKEGTALILRRFIRATVLISVLLLVLNGVLLAAWVLKGMNTGQSPAAVVERVSKGLTREAAGLASYTLQPAASELLDQRESWAMLINQSGQAVWSYRLPSEVPTVYSLTDVARFTQRYIMDYPVFVRVREEGLLVVGYPADSLAKYQYIVPTSWVSYLPARLGMLFLINLALALLLSLFIGSRMNRSIRPLAQGIQALGEDREAYVEPKGILAHLASSINRASMLLREREASLKKRDEARSNWIAGISHDIRTPLSMVLGHSSDLEDSPLLPEEQRNQAGIIRKQAESMRSLVQDLNLVSMLEYEMQPVNRKPVRLAALARQIVSDFLNNGLEEPYTVELEETDEGAQVSGDERLLTRAIVNLIQNSIHHNPGGCRIGIRVTGGRSEVEAGLGLQEVCRISIADNGGGFPQEELPDLLELPYSSRRMQPRQNGHGLGLPMAARIAAAHGGRLLLDSQPGGGFRAQLLLPAISSAPSEAISLI